MHSYGFFKSFLRILLEIIGCFWCWCFFFFRFWGSFSIPKQRPAPLWCIFFCFEELTRCFSWFGVCYLLGAVHLFWYFGFERNMTQPSFVFPLVVWVWSFIFPSRVPFHLAKWANASVMCFFLTFYYIRYKNLSKASRWTWPVTLSKSYSYRIVSLCTTWSMLEASKWTRSRGYGFHCMFGVCFFCLLQ